MSIEQHHIERRTGNEELTALAALTFDWTRALDDVWTDQRYHVDGLHAVTAALIGSGIRTIAADGARPLGIVIQGQRGVGKTHLLGWTREQVQRDGGFFFLVGDLFTKAFWEQVLGSMVEQLLPLPDGSRNQLATLLTRLADLVGLDGSFRAQVTGEVPPTPEGRQGVHRGAAPGRPLARPDLPGHRAGAGPAGVAAAGGPGRRLLLPDRQRGRPAGPPPLAHQLHQEDPEAARQRGLPAAGAGRAHRARDRPGRRADRRARRPQRRRRRRRRGRWRTWRPG